MHDQIGNGGAIAAQVKKIDNQAVSGLLGTQDSLAYKVSEIEAHIHNHEHWRGKLSTQTATNWMDNTLSPFTATSGSNAYGTEAQIIGSGDTPISFGMVKYDCYRVLIHSLSSNTVWKLRLVWGTGTLAQSITAGQFSELMVLNIIATGNAGGFPVDFRMPRLSAGVKVWMQAWNASNNATCDFTIGIHEYNG